MRLLFLAAFAVLLPRAQAADPKPLAVVSFAGIAADTDALFAGKSPSPATFNLFKTYDNATHTYVRNPECVAAGLDLTCVSVANSANADGTGGNRGCVTMVTPLHGVTNAHFGPPNMYGVVYYFVDRANTVYTRRIVAGAPVGATDLALITFDSPLPASVRPAQLLPAGVVNHLLPGTPLLATNQQKRVVVTELAGLAGGEIVVRPAVAPGRRAWTASPPAVIGDSDSPTFVLIDGKPRLLLTYHTNITGPAPSENLTALRAMIGDKYPLDVATLR